MTDATLIPRSTASVARPLCVRYLLFVPGAISVEVANRSMSSNQNLHWALGVLADGSYEVLGVWLASMKGETAWDAARSDLYVRGVEKVRYVVPDGGEMSELVPTRHRGALLASRGIMRELQRRAVRAVRHHGPFESVAEAASFVADALDRAELRLGDPVPMGSEPGSGQASSSGRLPTAPALAC